MGVCIEGNKEEIRRGVEAEENSRDRKLGKKEEGSRERKRRESAFCFGWDLMNLREIYTNREALRLSFAFSCV